MLEVGRKAGSPIRYSSFCCRLRSCKSIVELNKNLFVIIHYFCNGTIKTNPVEKPHQVSEVWVRHSESFCSQDLRPSATIEASLSCSHSPRWNPYPMLRVLCENLLYNLLFELMLLIGHVEDEPRDTLDAEFVYECFFESWVEANEPLWVLSFQELFEVEGDSFLSLLYIHYPKPIIHSFWSENVPFFSLRWFNLVFHWQFTMISNRKNLMVFPNSFAIKIHQCNFLAWNTRKKFMTLFELLNKNFTAAFEITAELHLFYWHFSMANGHNFTCKKSVPMSFILFNENGEEEKFDLGRDLNTRKLHERNPMKILRYCIIS